MKVAVIKERGEHETRVAASPESVKKLVGLGLAVHVESGAGARARFSDDDYRSAGADISSSADGLLGDADVLHPDVIQEHVEKGKVHLNRNPDQ